MVVGKDKHRKLITFPKKLEEDLEEIAGKDKRSFSNLVVKICEEYMDKHRENKEPHS